MALSRTAKILIAVGLGGLAIAVPSMLAAGATGGYFLRSKAIAAKKRAATIGYQNIGLALQMHRVKSGAYPQTAEGLDALVRAGELPQVPLDPWGKPYAYELDGDVPSVKSAGPDGQLGTADDIGGPLRH